MFLKAFLKDVSEGLSTTGLPLPLTPSYLGSQGDRERGGRGTVNNPCMQSGMGEKMGKMNNLQSEQN
eukprot:2750934-Amphidinium_carterae.1